jgi:hypothetical protein
MDTGQDVTRIVRSWLGTDEHESADRVLGIVLAQLDTTSQRPSWWPARRIAEMNNVAKFAIGAAAVMVVALVGYSIARPTAFGPGIAAPSPSTSPSATPSPTPAITPDINGDIWRTGSYDAGRYSATQGNVPFTFALPNSGWFSYAWTAMIEKGTFTSANYAWIGFQWGGSRTNDIDPCNGQGGSPTGSTIEEIAAAYTKIPGTDAVGPMDVTVGGRPAKLVVLTIHDDIPCSPNRFTFDDKHTWPNALTSEVRLWFTDVDGKRFSIHSDRTAPNPELEQEIQEIVDSIQFE